MDTERGCFLPAAQAGAVGVLAGFLILALAMVRGWSGPGWYALGVGSLAALAVFLSGVSAWRRVAFPLDQARIEYPPAETLPAETVQVQLTYDEDGARHHQLQDLPVDYDRMKTLADGLLAGTTFAESVWCGAGRPFSKSEFHQLRRAMLSRGWLQWRNPSAPAQGVQLSKPGAAVMRGFCATTTRPTPSRSLSDRVAQ